jgi:hypothetical protein
MKPCVRVSRSLAAKCHAQGTLAVHDGTAPQNSDILRSCGTRGRNIFQPLRNIRGRGPCLSSRRDKAEPEWSIGLNGCHKLFENMKSPWPVTRLKEAQEIRPPCQSALEGGRGKVAVACWIEAFAVPVHMVSHGNNPYSHAFKIAAFPQS